MSPEPYVRGQAAVLAGIFLAAASVGPPIATLVCALVGATAARALYRKHVGERHTTGVPVPTHRERLDLIVTGDARATFGIGLTAGGVMLAFDVDGFDAGLDPATPTLICVAATTIYLSSLIDWYLTLPRISGQLGLRPCRPGAQPFHTFPKTWRQTTQWWYIHRIVAALVLRFGLSFAVTLTVDDYLSLPGGTSIVAGAAVGFLAAYQAAVSKAVFEAGHPTMIVGRTIERYEKTERKPLATFKMKGRTIRIPGFKQVGVGPRGEREYVFDIAVEQVQVVPAASREGEIPRDEEGNVVYEADPRKVRLKHLLALQPEPAQPPFVGCSERCSGINWYCIENPRCFEPK